MQLWRRSAFLCWVLSHGCCAAKLCLQASTHGYSAALTCCPAALLCTHCDLYCEPHCDELLPCRYLVFNGSFVLLAAYSLYYLTLEPFAGLTWGALVALPMWGTANAVCAALPCAWGWAIGLHVLSWVVQVRGRELASRHRHIWAGPFRLCSLQCFAQQHTQQLAAG